MRVSSTLKERSQEEYCNAGGCENNEFACWRSYLSIRSIFDWKAKGSVPVHPPTAYFANKTAPLANGALLAG